MKVALILIAIVAAVAANSYNYKKQHEYYAPAHYSYDYAVKDDYHYVNMGQYESRYGDKTNGNYHVVLPDGRRQTVNYYVDGYSGYVADVQYDGYARPYHYKPAYKSNYYKSRH